MAASYDQRKLSLLADAAGVLAISAASLVGYIKPLKLHINSGPIWVRAKRHSNTVVLRYVWSWRMYVDGRIAVISKAWM